MVGLSHHARKRVGSLSAGSPERRRKFFFVPMSLLVLLVPSLLLHYYYFQEATATSDHHVPSQLSSTMDFIPATCDKYVVKDIPSLKDLLMKGKDAKMGHEGGEWSACTHLKNYGMNFAAFFARHLAYGIKPKSVLEFGCGLGTTSDFLARFVPGGSKVVCVEPEATVIKELFGEGGSNDTSKHFPNRPVQLSMLSFSFEAKECADAIYNPQMGFELVLSLEVAEHIPAEFQEEFIQRLATATTKYLVFAAARPGQGGTGHITDSMHTREWWIEKFTNADRGSNAGKLKLLPQLSRGIRYVTGWDRAYDFGTNLVAFGAPGVEDISQIPQIADDCSFLGRPKQKDLYGDDADRKYAKEHGMPEFLNIERPCEKNGQIEDRNEKRAQLLIGQAQALWPELDLLIRQVNAGEFQC